MIDRGARSSKAQIGENLNVRGGRRGSRACIIVVASILHGDRIVSERQLRCCECRFRDGRASDQGARQRHGAAHLSAVAVERHQPGGCHSERHAWNIGFQHIACVPDDVRPAHNVHVGRGRRGRDRDRRGGAARVEAIVPGVAHLHGVGAARELDGLIFGVAEAIQREAAAVERRAVVRHGDASRRASHLPGRILRARVAGLARDVHSQQLRGAVLRRRRIRARLLAG